MSSAKVAFLDRDGVINVDKDYVFRVEDWQFSPNAPQAIRRLKEAGYRVVVVSNQSGIGRGYYTAADVNSLHDHVQEQLREAGTEIDLFAYCPHLPTSNCQCRKPKTGMMPIIGSAFDEMIDMRRSWMCGDRVTDVEFGQTLGCRTGLIHSKHWTPATLNKKPDWIGTTLDQFSLMVVSEDHPD